MNHSRVTHRAFPHLGAMAALSVVALVPFAVCAAPGLPAVTLTTGADGEQTYSLGLQILALMSGLTLLPAALIIVGADDHAFLAAADAMAAKIPNAVKHVVPDAGHAANMDQPAIVNDLLREFLAKRDPSATSQEMGSGTTH